MLSKESDDKIFEDFLTENPFFQTKDSPFPLLNIYSNRQTTSVLSLVFELSIIRTKRAHFVTQRECSRRRVAFGGERILVLLLWLFLLYYCSGFDF